MTGDAVAAALERRAVDASWVRGALDRHWPARGCCSSIVALSVDGAVPLTHTGSLWHIGGPAPHVLKVALDPCAARPPAFYELKAEVLNHCVRQGVPVVAPVLTATGAPVAWHEGRLCELSPLAAGTTIADADAATVAAVVKAGLALRRALDGLAPQLADELASMPVPKLVEQERWAVAMTDAMTRLRSIAADRADAWGHAVTRVLAGIAAAAPLLRRRPSAASAAPRHAVIHADLHVQHFLMKRGPAPRIAAILDFDNLQVGDPLLDLAWIAYTVASVVGDRRMRGTVAQFAAAASAEGLLAARQRSLLMPALIIHVLPVLVDIAKDILERDRLDPTWLAYFKLLDVERMLRVHSLLTGHGA